MYLEVGEEVEEEGEEEDCAVVTSEEDVTEEADVTNDVEDDDKDDDGEDNDADCEDDKNGTFASSNVPGESVVSGDEVAPPSLVFNGEREDSFAEADEATCTEGVVVAGGGDDAISSGFAVDCSELLVAPTDDTVALGDNEIARVSSTSTSLLLLSGDDDDAVSVGPFVSPGTLSFELSIEYEKGLKSSDVVGVLLGTYIVRARLLNLGPKESSDVVTYLIY